MRLACRFKRVWKVETVDCVTRREVTLGRISAVKGRFRALLRFDVMFGQTEDRLDGIGADGREDGGHWRAVRSSAYVSTLRLCIAEDATR